MTFYIWGIRTKVHWTLFLLFPLAAISGLPEILPVVVVSMAAHEAAHAITARVSGVGMRELLLTPFGGALRIDGLWGYRPGQIASVALAGPAASLLIVTCSAALAYGGIISEASAGEWVRVNLLLAAFNLMPALPLDGGRVLCAFLSIRMNPAKALRIGIILGVAFGSILLVLAIWQFILTRKVNLTILLCSVYLILAGTSEKSASDGVELLSLLARRDELLLEGTLPVFWLAAAKDLPCSEILLKLRPRRVHRIAVYDDAIRLIGIIEERTLIAAVRRGAPSTLGELVIKWGNNSCG